MEKIENKHKHSILLKVMVTLGLLIFVISGLIIIRAYDPYHAQERGFHLVCLFNEVTGFYCPSCGISRMFYELSHLNFIDAIRNNAIFFFFFIPIVIYISLKYYLRFILEKDVLPGIKFNKWIIVLAIIIFILFTVVRNIPSEPFDFFAPLIY